MLQVITTKLYIYLYYKKKHIKETQVYQHSHFSKKTVVLNVFVFFVLLYNEEFATQCRNQKEKEEKFFFQ